MYMHVYVYTFLSCILLKTYFLKGIFLSTYIYLNSFKSVSPIFSMRAWRQEEIKVVIENYIKPMSFRTRI